MTAIGFMKVSIIVPCYNAMDKIGRCIASLRAIKFDRQDFEVIFIDDCSKDGTFELLQSACKESGNWATVQLKQNSGSPSAPRNVGIQLAQGEYIYFLDCDDEILPDALDAQYTLALNTGADIVRSELLVDNGSERRLMNGLPGWNHALTYEERCALIIGRQSTVAPSFIKTSLLKNKNIHWPEHIRMGEDTIFLSLVLKNSKNVEFIPLPTFIYHKIPSLTPASTQRYGKRELMDHLEVWQSAQNILKPIGVDYLAVRLHVGLRVSLESMIFRNRGDIDKVAFEKLCEFVQKHWLLIKEFKYTERLKDVLKAIYQEDYLGFLKLCRPRLLIAGHDLKFIKDAIPDLQAFFDIRIDEWKGHAIHDETASLKHIAWAELIWCEWLLKNAEWYAQHKRPNQRLVVRMHRMELGRNHGELMDVSKIDAIVTVSVLFFERLLERYPNIPRHKVRLIDNYVRTEEYRQDWHPDRMFTIGMIGILPARKGLMRALNILRELRRHDSRFRLEIFGHRPEDLSWVARNADEMAYFDRCREFINQNGLSDAVVFNGHVNVKVALAARKVGFVLSTSESELGFPGPESFHLAVADGFAAGG